MKLHTFHATVTATQARSDEAARLPSSPDTQAALAWRREMERAQADAWFKGSLPTPDSHLANDTQQHSTRYDPAGRSRAAFDAPADHRSPDTVHADVLGTATVTASPSVKPALQPGSLIMPTGSGTRIEGRIGLISADSSRPTGKIMGRQQSAPEPARVNPASLSSGFGTQVDADEDAPASEGPSASPRRDAAGASDNDAQPLVRVHVEGDAERSTVWLGIDASARPSLLAITEVVSRWLARAGYGTPTWICNGQAIGDPGDGDASYLTPADKPVKAALSFKIEPPIGESA
ncbi:MAG TPA: hypothetical protein VFY73_01360 [Ideonella sp.]|uniref:hypothetical protein n=1 Tax=Ideonella sp. TaxID=1929293 RepID=UPI002E343EFC|nr:hypothetical protein [Ideonella sp.]HEX5682655.1 hypothetical protein [Ideonella sp.]